MNIENYVRGSIKQCIDNFPEYGEDVNNQDYLHLFNHSSVEEEMIIKKIFKDIILLQEQLIKIQDDCYGR